MCILCNNNKEVEVMKYEKGSMRAVRGLWADRSDVATIFIYVVLKSKKINNKRFHVVAQVLCLRNMVWSSEMQCVLSLHLCSSERHECLHMAGTRLSWKTQCPSLGPG